MKETNNTQQTGGSRGIFFLLALLLVFAPLFRAGNLPLPLLVIELVSLVMLGWLVWQWPDRRPLEKGHWLVLGGLVMLPLLHLLPLPFSLWQGLPGRQRYASGLEAAGDPLTDFAYSVSLVPQLTEYALWALLPPLIVFLATLSLPRERIRQLVHLLIAVALFQALLGLLQFGGGRESWLYFGSPYADGSAAGTYYNRDHLAGFLEMVFPVVLGLFAATVGHHLVDTGRGPRWRRRMEFLSSMTGHKAFLYAAAAVLIILALIFTKSRMGVALTMVGLFLVLLAFSRRLGGNNVYGTYGTVVAVIVVLAVEIGLAPVLDRFTHDPTQDLRWTIYETASEGVKDFFPLGSGPGTFPRVYPAYQPQEVDGFVNRAHNDYLEWIFDGGLPAALLILMALALFVRQWGRVWIHQRWREFRYIQVGAGIGIVLMLIHSVLDFNLHKPANAIFFAFLLAVFFRENREEFEARKRHRPRTPRIPRKAAPAAATPTPMAQPPAKPAEEDPDSPLAGW